jgi:serine/threonine protein phosphatase PrpC
MPSIQSFSLHFGYSRHLNFDPPDEDYAVCHEKTFPVFDGVTLLHQNPYPNPSPAAKAAKIGAEKAIDYLESMSESNLSPQRRITSAFRAANQAIREYNTSLGITTETVDYLDIQYAAAVGAFGYLNGNEFYGGQITDSGIMVVDENGCILANAILDRSPLDGYLNELRASGKLVAGSPQEHVFIRKNVVNNPTLAHHGQPVNFAVMTGEKSAEQFFRYSHFPLKPGHIIILYSDGFIPILEDQTFRNLLVKDFNLQLARKWVAGKVTDRLYCDEKTAIIIKIEE